MKAKTKDQRFYGNALLGTWSVPSTGRLIIPQLYHGSQRMVWYTGRGNDVVYGIEWIEDEELKERQIKNGKSVTFTLMPYYNGEKLEYDEAA